MTPEVAARLDGHGELWVAVSGEIDAFTAPDLGVALRSCLAADPQLAAVEPAGSLPPPNRQADQPASDPGATARVTVDLTAIGFCSVAGLVVLHDAIDVARQRGAAVRVCGVSPPVRRVAQASGLGLPGYLPSPTEPPESVPGHIEGA